MKKYKHITDEEIEYAAAEHIKGRTMKDISQELDVSISLLWNKLKIWGIPYKRKNCRPKTYKPIEKCSKGYQKMYQRGFEAGVEQGKKDSLNWIPVKWRDMDEEEKEHYREVYCDEPSQIADFPIPDDGDEILISRNSGKWVDIVVFCNDEYGIGDEDGSDWLTEVDAWMPVPKGYIKEQEYAEKL